MEYKQGGSLYDRIKACIAFLGGEHITIPDIPDAFHQEKAPSVTILNYKQELQEFSFEICFVKFALVYNFTT